MWSEGGSERAMGEVTVQTWDMGTDKPLFLVMRRLDFCDMGAGGEINSLFSPDRRYCDLLLYLF